jgi:hypothetical protein
VAFLRRLGVWTLLGAAVVLGARAISYALAPSQATLVSQLEHRAGGPDVAVMLAAVVAIGAVLAAGVLAFAVVAVRERLALEVRAPVDPPRLRPARLAARAGGLFALTVAAFGCLESYLHWRAGLGWHGVSCVFGPLHRDAIPVLSTVATALHGAIEHLLAWTRRLVATLAARLPRAVAVAAATRARARPRTRRIVAAADPRGPPGLLASVL